MRPNKDWAMLGMAMLLGSNAACARRQVGCILTDEASIIVGSGYNGRIAGVPNCEEPNLCVGHCEGMHAEINALLRRTGSPANAYVSCMPCLHCAKALVAAGARRIVTCMGPMDAEQKAAQDLWRAFGFEILELNCPAAMASDVLLA